MKANTTSALDFAQELLGVSFARRSVMSGGYHSRPQAGRDPRRPGELGELTQKVAAETVEPIKANASKTHKPWPAFS